jgi:ribosomal protein S18 acetylase RimI-like enzyme
MARGKIPQEPNYMGIYLRTATIADAVQIARLVSGLGYPTAPAQMQKRLQTILSNNDYVTMVACDGDTLVGFIGTRIGPLYEDDGQYGQIMALAVASDYQRQGIGRMLLQAAESELMKYQISILVVTSGNQRSDAHAFYERNGYAWTGRRYARVPESAREEGTSGRSLMRHAPASPKGGSRPLSGSDS